MQYAFNAIGLAYLICVYNTSNSVAVQCNAVSEQQPNREQCRHRRPFRQGGAKRETIKFDCSHFDLICSQTDWYDFGIY